MIRQLLICAVALVVLSACSKTGDQDVTVTSAKRMRGGEMAAASIAPAPGRPASDAAPEENAPKLAYTHNMALEMASDKVAARYERARDSCLNNKGYGCTLVHASISVGDEQSGTPPYAALTVRLPHDKIAAFQAELLSPLKDEKQGEPVLRSSTTDAEDLTYVILDTDRRLAQLTDYRDRLIELSKRSGAKVEDLITVEERISQVQSEIEQLTAQQRQLNLRVDTEVLSISLSALQTLGNVQSPLARAWRQAGDTLGESAAEAFTFLVQIVPWLPIIAIGFLVLRWLWRLVRGRGWRFARGEKAEASG